jgi:hypothetical protein
VVPEEEHDDTDHIVEDDDDGGEILCLDRSVSTHHFKGVGRDLDEVWTGKDLLANVRISTRRRAL